MRLAGLRLPCPRYPSPLWLHRNALWLHLPADERAIGLRVMTQRSMRVPVSFLRSDA